MAPSRLIMDVQTKKESNMKAMEKLSPIQKILPTATPNLKL
jgi:hypothetical protein